MAVHRRFRDRRFRAYPQLHAMNSRPNFSRFLARGRLHPRAARTAAFTIMQVMVSMSVGSIVMSFAVPKVKQSERQSRATIIVADLRTFASAFEAYAQEQGGWPEEAEAAVVPPEMVQRLGSTAWLRPTPIGGSYNWESAQTHGGVQYRAAISITETAESPLPINEQLLLDIDRLMDDGNLNTGQFRTGVNYDPLFIIQQ